MAATTTIHDDAPLVMPLPDRGRTVGERIDTFDPLDSVEGGWGAHLRTARQAALDFRAEFAATGTPDWVTTVDLIGLPYPTKFGLFRAPLSPAPYVTITNRMMVVRWTGSDGQTKTMLWEPSDVELDANTPYFKSLADKYPDQVTDRLKDDHGRVLDALPGLAIEPADVDYLAFDHLHTQDVRHWLGTTAPQADISPTQPVTGAFPNAKLIVQREELEAMADLHPLQRPWYQPQTYVDLPSDRIITIDGSVLLGPGVAIVKTPGHVVGNQSLVLNTTTGIWACSENVIATECLTPEHSKIPGVAKWAARWGQEVILNANTIETTAQQYNSCVLEKHLVDRAQSDSRFLQFFPSSELTGRWISPGTSPTFVHRRIEHGRA